MDYTSIKVGQLPTADISGGNFIPHEVSGLLKKATITDLAAFINASGAVGFRAVSISDGGTLPTTDTNEFILVGPGTYNNVEGASPITVTEELNALVSNGDYWFIGVEIPIDAPPGDAIWGEIVGTLSNQTDLQNVLNLKADLVDGKVPAAQLPSYVDDIIEVANYAALPATGETGKIYLTLDNNKIYRWSGSVYIEIAAENAVWGQIVGTLSNQTDLQSALNLRVPYTGATANVDLGTHTLSSKNLVVNHTSGSGVAAQITKGGNGEALTVVKSSGTGNAASITGGVTLLSELHLNTDLADAYIASAAIWNAKQDALNGTGFVKISGTTISYDNTSYLPLTGGTVTGTLTMNGSGGTTAPIVSIFNSGINRLLTPVLRLYGADTIASKYIELFGTNATTNRAIQFPDASGTVVLGTGTSNYLPKFTGESSLGNSLIFDNGTGVGIGTTTLTGRSLVIAISPSGSSTYFGLNQNGLVQSSIINLMIGYNNSAQTVASSFNLPEYIHFRAFQATFGATSTVTTQTGFRADSTLIGATNNYGFFGAIPSGSNRWNLYMEGTANNYLAGNLGINSTNPTSKLQVVGLPEYATNALAITGGLTVGAFYHTAGVLKVVI